MHTQAHVPSPLPTFLAIHPPRRVWPSQPLPRYEPALQAKPAEQGSYQR